MSRTVVYVPLENLPQRYTPMANEQMAALCDSTVGDCEGGRASVISHGQFLDIVETNVFKAEQCSRISRLLGGWIKGEKGALFFADIYHPGVTVARYIIDLMGLDIIVGGFNYAGRADPNDFLQRCGEWCMWQDAAFNAACNTVFVGSPYHRRNVERMMAECRIAAPPEVMATGYAWNPEWVNRVRAEPIKPTLDKIPRVIWPHRWCDEKGTDRLMAVARMMPDTEFVVTSCGKVADGAEQRARAKNVVVRDMLTKQEYYRLMNDSRFYLSTARQETFGYTLQEAILHRCVIAVPTDACYPDMVSSECLYASLCDIPAMFMRGHVEPLSATMRHATNAYVAVSTMRDAT